MPHAGLEGSFYDSDTMQFEALTSGIDVRTNELPFGVALTGGGIQVIVVIGDIHFLDALVLEVKAIHLAGEQKQFIEQEPTTQAGHWCVIGKFRSKLYPALAGGIAPGPSRFADSVQVVEHTGDLPGLAGRLWVIE